MVRIVFSYGAENVRTGFPRASNSPALKISKWHFTESDFGLPQAPAKMTPADDAHRRQAKGSCDSRTIMQTHCEQITRIEQPERRVSAFDAPDLRGLVLSSLFDVRTGIPGGILEFLVPTIKRANHQQIWIPGVNFSDDPIVSRR
jgi:hypothetical protein